MAGAPGAGGGGPRSGPGAPTQPSRSGPNPHMYTCTPGPRPLCTQVCTGAHTGISHLAKPVLPQRSASPCLFHSGKHHHNSLRCSGKKKKKPGVILGSLLCPAPHRHPHSSVDSMPKTQPASTHFSPVKPKPLSSSVWAVAGVSPPPTSHSAASKTFPNLWFRSLPSIFPFPLHGEETPPSFPRSYQVLHDPASAFLSSHLTPEAVALCSPFSALNSPYWLSPRGFCAKSSLRKEGGKIDRAPDLC